MPEMEYWEDFYKPYNAKSKDMDKRLRVLTDMLLFEGKNSAGIPGGIKKFYFSAKRKKKKTEDEIELISAEARNVKYDIAELVFINEFPETSEIQDYFKKKIITIENYKKELITEKSVARKDYILGINEEIESAVTHAVTHLEDIKRLSRKKTYDEEAREYFREEIIAAEKCLGSLDRKKADLKEKRNAIKKCIEVTEKFLRETFYKFTKRGVSEAVMRKIYKIFADEVGDIKMDYISRKKDNCGKIIDK